LFGVGVGTVTVGCLDYLTGAGIWRHSFETDHTGIRTHSSLLVTAEQIFVTFRSTLKAFARDTGAALWTQNVPGAPTDGTKHSIGLAVPGRVVQTDLGDV
jgi:outer membrane protein assembly factor BamB